MQEEVYWPAQKAAPAGWARDPPLSRHTRLSTCHAEGIVLVKYFFGDQSESVTSPFGVLSKYAEFTTRL